MSRRTQSRARRYRTSKQRVPDFARLYGDGPRFPTPRMAHTLWRAAGELWNDWRGEVDDPEDLLVELPWSARQVADRSWMRRFAECLHEVRRRLETADLAGLPRCAGDELALYLVLHHADSEHFLWRLDCDPAHRQLPAHELDEDFLLVIERLFPDTAVLELFEAQYVGVDFDEKLEVDLRMAPLRAADWFPSVVLGDHQTDGRMR